MTTPTDQFVDIANRSQEAVATAVHNWADTVQSFASKLTAGQSQLPDPHTVVDQYFDFAEKVLASQREALLLFPWVGSGALRRVRGRSSQVKGAWRRRCREGAARPP